MAVISMLTHAKPEPRQVQAYREDTSTTSDRPKMSSADSIKTHFRIFYAMKAWKDFNKK